MSEWTLADGVTKLRFQNGDPVDYTGPSTALKRGWIRGLDLTGSEPTFKVYNNGKSVWATADELAPRDSNPHPGYEHWPAYCPNCGY